MRWRHDGQRNSLAARTYPIQVYGSADVAYWLMQDIGVE